ncbi:MAG: hypothetical protein HFJ51_01660 [Clostridia bacterium]|nr:hypothetical protein [Clostridia bacterium]
MQIKLDLKIFIFVLFFFVTKQLEMYIYLMIFALFHELGHIVCGLLLGLRLEKLQIMPVRICSFF